MVQRSSVLSLSTKPQSWI